MALSADTRPHFTTIAHFVSSMKDQITSIFRDVIVLCHAEGLIGKKMFAIDGCKISSNCSKEWSGTKKHFKKKVEKLEQSLKFLIDKQQKADSKEIEEDQKSKEKKAIASIHKTIKKIGYFLENMEEKLGSRGKPIQSNITDNESAKMPTSHGMIQGYTGVATVDSKHQVIVQAEAHGENQEKELLKPAIDDIQETFKERNLDTKILKKVNLRKHTNTSGLVGKMYKANTRECKVCKLRPHCIQGGGPGPRRVAKYTHRTPTMPETPSQRMMVKIDSEKGRFVYSRRMGIVEPIFANICHTTGLDYFTMRGKVKVDIQWKLFCIVHNLKKIFKYGALFA